MLYHRSVTLCHALLIQTLTLADKEQVASSTEGVVYD